MGLSAATSQSHTQSEHSIYLQWVQPGQLQLLTGFSWERVAAKRSFPWSRSLALISLCNEDGEEVGFIQDVSDLDEGSQQALIAALENSAETFEVNDIIDTTEEFELRSWRVITSNGSRVFQTTLSSRPASASDGGLLIKDINSDLYVISQPGGLPEKARALLHTVMS